jgi:hypothetical protein
MKTLLVMVLLAVCSAVAAVPTMAQDRIELYADQQRSSCSIVEPLSPPIVQVHIFLTGPVGATAVRFTAPKPACWVGATWLGDALIPGEINVSNSQSDWSIAFGHCTVPGEPYYIGAISYLISNQALPCCVVSAYPSYPNDPAQSFEFVDCDFAEHTLDPTKSIVVNPSESCGCQSGSTLAVEASSWGRLKALYR